MNNQELDNILKSARVPERYQEDFDNFAGRVQREVQRRENDGHRRVMTPSLRSAGLWPAGAGGVSPPIPLLQYALRPRLAFGFALACFTLVFAYSLWRPQSAFVPGDQVAAA